MVQTGGVSMGRQNYMTITVAETVQDMFNEFVSEKQITKTAALNDVIEMYMLAKDEKLYFKLKKKYLNVEGVTQMIKDRDDNSVDNDFLFMKLGSSTDVSGNTLDGQKTIDIYVEDEIKRGFTWFSTQALYYGMSEKRVKNYKKLITSGETVKILFGIGKSAIVNNDIAYSAVIHDIISNKSPMSAPTSDYPDEYKDQHARIWIKISGIKVESKINASMLKVKSTGADLKQVISKSQYHFGYVCFK